MSDPENQHITPKLIVRRFKIKGNPLFVIEEDGKLDTWNEANSITRMHHYSLKDDEKNKYKVEKGLGDYENKFGKALKEIEDALNAGNSPPISDNRDCVFDFILKQIVRSVEFNNGPSEENMNAGYQAAIDAAKEKFGDSLLGKEFTDEDKERIMHNSRKLSILEHIGAPENIIRGLNISLGQTSDKIEFITGSCPLSLDVPIDINSKKKRRVVLPVGLHLSIILSDDPEGEIHSLSDADVDAINHGIARKSKIIVGSSEEVIKQYEAVRATDL